MKTSSLPSHALAVVLAAGLAAESYAYTWGGKLDMTVVSEFADSNVKRALPTAEQPAYYVAYDGGYIESGDPIAGEKPPPAATVAQALRIVLASRHYLPASARSAPTLLLIYHWGLIRPGSYQFGTSFRLQPNLNARIALVAPKKYAQRIKEDLLDLWAGGLYIPIIHQRERDLLHLAGEERYFVIVSALDYASVARNACQLLWRVKLSTRSVGVAMAEALPALLRGGAPYLGRNLEDTQFVREPVVPEGRVEIGTPKLEEFLPPPEVERQLHPQYLKGLIERDHAPFTGELSPFYPMDVDMAPRAARDASTAFLPPALADRIHAYEYEKAALQGSLAALIKQRAPGADTRLAIDTFIQANATRIASLTREREAIRDELARLAAATTDAATGKSLNTLLKEFADGVQEMETSPRPYST